MKILKDISEIVDRILPQITDLRHAIHSNPELAGNEFETAKLIRETLQYTDIDLLKPYLETDVVGILDGEKSGKCVALRADTDALPLQEAGSLLYKSRNDGIMHACGHDGHTAILLGAAMVLNEIKNQLCGTVKFIFQPGEEVAALGKKLVEAGVLNSPKTDAVFALHCFSGLPVGTISSRPGAVMAAAGFFKIKVIGKGGHGSKPESCIDPILTACQVVNQLQTIVSRNFAPQDAACLSVCHISGGSNSNVIPAEVVMEGTTRFLDNSVGERFPKLIEDIAKGVCQANGADYEFEYKLTYLPTVNSLEYVEIARAVTEECFGAQAWLDQHESSMGAEDFSYYLSNCPGAFCSLGVGKDHPAIHNPEFDFEDKALRNGIIFMVMTAIRVMEIT